MILNFKKVACLVLVLAAFAASGCKEKPNEAEARASEVKTRAVKVSVMKINPAPMRDILTLPGGTEAINDVRLAAETDGTVEWIGPSEGDSVKKDQLIAKVDVKALQTVLQRAQADYKLKQDLAKRRELLHKKKAIPQEDLDRILTERLVAKQALVEARVRYEQGRIKSPLKGRVNHLYVDQGEFVGRGDPVADIVDLEKVKINLNVPELDVRFIQPGEPALITIDAYPERKWMGKVEFVAFKADPATKTFRVRVLVENKDRAIRPGMIARASLERRFIKDALAIPMFAVLDKGGERVIFVEKDGVAQARAIEIGVIGQDRIQITKGINPGENLIISGQNEVEQGMAVTVQ